MKWIDLKKGDVLVISKQALKIRAAESWTQDPYYRNCLYIVTEITLRDQCIDVCVQDSEKLKGPWSAPLGIDGSLSGCPGHPFFEIISLAEEE